MIIRASGKPVLPERAGRWEGEMEPDPGEETFGAEANPTGNPIGGGQGYSDAFEDGDFVVRSYEELRAALAAAGDGQVVFVPASAQVDFGGRDALEIPEGVIVASDRGQQGSLGALLFSAELTTPGMLSTAGDCVRLTGLRIRGPYQERERVAHSSRGFAAYHYAAEIDNCELFGFANAASSFRVGASRGYVHHNCIHHNQRGGLGYGVSVAGGEALVEANLFDYCRHHVACTGTPGSAYEARYNICGEHANGHLFDVHGGRDRGDGTDIAGDWLNLHHNTLRCTEAHSVAVRGMPSQRACIHHNWFYSVDPTNIVLTDGNTWVYRNRVGRARKLLEGRD